MKYERRLNTHGFRLPEIFKFVLSEQFIEECEGIGSDMTYTATLNKNSQYVVTWDEEGINHGTTYHTQEVYDAINDGVWLLTQ